MPAEAGNYHGQLVAAGTAKINNDKATPYMYLGFNVTHMAHDGEWKPISAPFQRDVQLWLTEKAWPYTQEKLQSLGFNGDFAHPHFDERLYTEGLELECSHEYSDDGAKTYERWNLAHGGGGREHAAADKSTVQLLNARWKTAAGTPAAPAGPAAPPPRPAGVPQGTDDSEPPF